MLSGQYSQFITSQHFLGNSFIARIPSQIPLTVLENFIFNGKCYFSFVFFAICRKAALLARFSQFAVVFLELLCRFSNEVFLHNKICQTSFCSESKRLCLGRTLETEACLELKPEVRQFVLNLRLNGKDSQQMVKDMLCRK